MEIIQGWLAHFFVILLNDVSSLDTFILLILSIWQLAGWVSRRVLLLIFSMEKCLMMVSFQDPFALILESILVDYA